VSRFRNTDLFEPTPWTASSKATSFTRLVPTIRGKQRHRGFTCLVSRRTERGQQEHAPHWRALTFARKPSNAVKYAQQYARQLNKESNA
jgi:hypothetical protein